MFKYVIALCIAFASLFAIPSIAIACEQQTEAAIFHNKSSPPVTMMAAAIVADEDEGLYKVTSERTVLRQQETAVILVDVPKYAKLPFVLAKPQTKSLLSVHASTPHEVGWQRRQ